MSRKENKERKLEELFGSPTAGGSNTDQEFMDILQGFIFGEVSCASSLDDRMRELVTITTLTTIQALPQLAVHVKAGMNVGCLPGEIRETIYQCAPFIGFPKTLNAIEVMNHVFEDNGVKLPLREQGTVTDEDRYEKGLEIQAPVYGTEILERYTWLPGEFAEAVPRYLTELCFGDFCTREGLDGKIRELLTVIILAALGGAEVQVKSHVEGALKMGNTKEEIVCALVQAAGYMGIPRLFNALNVSRELLDKDAE